MAKLNSHEQLLSSEYVGSTAINTNASATLAAATAASSSSILGVACGNNSSSNSMSTTFPSSNHHLLVRHAAIEITPPPPAISHSQHQLNSGNSFELNGGVTTSSLSEDSGLPLTTNSSISSGDSTRMGLCKFEFELATESDAEVSQFDSLENCSDGGMSAENFNTLKKVPLAPIDPPPEFQDSPQTTLLRSTTSALQSFSTKLAKNIVSTAITGGPNDRNSIYDEVPMNALIKTKSLEILPTTTTAAIETERDASSSSYAYDRLPRKRNIDYIVDDDESQMYQCEYHLYHRTTDDFYHTYDIYASDSVLNTTHIDNIYDVPCDEYVAAAANISCDSILERGDHFSLFDDHPLSMKVCDMSKAPPNRLHQMQLANEIHDYDLYYRKVKCNTNYDDTNKIGAVTTTESYSSGASTLASNTINSTASTNNSLRPSESSVATNHCNTDSLQQSKSSTLSSSKTKTTTSSSSASASITTFQHRKTPSILYSPLHYHHANSNLSTGNRPNSRNSLNSRLSSSHNSLTISSSNKADDSIFITQAMSHDALTSREISDFYNVPIDSDIYALPIDVIRPIFSSTNTTSRTCTSSRSQPLTTVAGCGSGGIANGVCKTSKSQLGGDKSTIKSTVALMQNTISNSDIQLPVSSRTSMLLKSGTKHFRGRLKYVRNNKRRKRQQQSLDSANGVVGNSNVIPLKSCRSSTVGGVTDKRHSVPENVIAAAVAEPMPKHLMLDEVKQQMMYTSLCSSSSESALELKAITKNMSNNFNSNCSNHSNSSGRINMALFGTFSSNKHSTTNNNNNNNNSTSFNHNNANNSIVILKSDRNFNLTHINNNNLNNNNNTINNSIGNSSHTKLLSTSSTPNHNANTANSKLSNARSAIANTTAAITAKNAAACNIKKINSSPSIAKETNSDSLTTTNATNAAQTSTTTKKSQFSISLNLKQKFCSIFRFRKSYSTHHHASSNNGSNHHRDMTDYEVATGVGGIDKKAKFSTRALPPLPPKFKGAARTESPATNESATTAVEENGDDRDGKKNDVQTTMDFAANIEKVKEYGWYWGPISSEAAEKILSNEPDGSFIVRDSSDDHYIFSLTFKLNNCVRHVRIEQDQGTFSFGSCAKFKSRTIMEFIENAVESSRSGRYLFFFHRRPEHGPMRVQLTNPVSRFKHIQSLQHMCRFVIRRAVVRKDLIQTLPLPRRLLDYLSYKNCYSEQVESDSSQSPTPENNEENHNSDEAEEHVILR